MKSTLPIGSWLRDTPWIILGIFAMFVLLAGCATTRPPSQRPSVSTQFIAQDVAAASGSVSAAKTHAEQALADSRLADFKESLLLRWEHQHKGTK